MVDYVNEHSPKQYDRPEFVDFGVVPTWWNNGNEVPEIEIGA